MMTGVARDAMPKENQLSHLQIMSKTIPEGLPSPYHPIAIRLN